MRLPSGKEMDSGEFAVNCETDVWDMDLGEMHIDLALSMDSSNILLVDNGEFQGVRKFRVDAACRCACIHQCRKSVLWHIWSLGTLGLINRIEADLYI